MIPWAHLDTATVPDGGGELKLMRRGTEFSIMAGAIELMNSRVRGSEEALATLTGAKIRDRKGARVLIGGLGMGFTLRAALADLGPDARITVAELVRAVGQWAKGPLAEVFGGCLDDPRVTLLIDDVADLITPDPVWDAILLDVDNGPEALTRPANDEIYNAHGLRMAFAALRPGGVLAVWSSAHVPAFTPKLRRAGFTVEEHKVRANGKGRGARHIIWVATKP